MRLRNLVILGAVVALIGGFLLFRPDKLFVDDPVDESLADAFATETTMAEGPMSVTTSVATTSIPETTMATETTMAPSTTLVAEPMRLSTGSFFGIDHSAAGTAAIYEQDGRYFLRLEDDTDIQNGPDLYVWLTEDTDWDVPGVHLDLGTLKGNVGGQNYELPPEFDPSIHRNVLIWCLRFAVPFAAAELS
ncbi:MAG: DM13 domain-containing protein [Acidimicrobiia bacterium]